MLDTDCLTSKKMELKKIRKEMERQIDILWFEHKEEIKTIAIYL